MQAATRSIVLKAVAAVAVLVALSILYRVLPVGAWLAAFRGWVSGLGTAGYAVYIVVYAACLVLFVPASILTLGAGLLFGVAKGAAVVIVGATAGAALSFLLARTVMRRRIESMAAANPRFRALDRAIAREGGRIVLLVRLSVVFPFTYSNYAFGLTGVGFGAYVLNTLVGIIPGTFAFVYIGALANEAATAGRARILVYAAGAVVALFVSVWVGRIATRAIREAGVQDEGPPVRG